MKIGRNQICPLCNSGKKYKKCCGKPLLNEKSTFVQSFPKEYSPEMKKVRERHKANELIREQQQGLGKPIIATMEKGSVLVFKYFAFYIFTLLHLKFSFVKKFTK